MKKKFRYYLPIISGVTIQKIAVVLCFIVAMFSYFTGDVDRATFWMICGMFNYLCYKL
jgi:hypothetical protein